MSTTDPGPTRIRWTDPEKNQDSTLRILIFSRIGSCLYPSDPLEIRLRADERTKYSGLDRVCIQRRHVNRGFECTDPAIFQDSLVSVPVGANRNQDSIERVHKISGLSLYPNPNILKISGLASVDPSDSVLSIENSNFKT